MKARVVGASPVRRACALIAASAVAGVLVSACGSSGDKPVGSQSTGAGAATKSLTKMTVEVPPPGMSDIFVNVMVDKGFLKDQGLDVKMVSMTPQDAVLGLESGSVNLALFGAATVVTSHSSGANVRIVAGGDQGTPFRLYGQKGISTVKELSGKTVGVTAIGDITQYLAEAYLQNAGVPVSSVKFVPLGFGPASLAGLQSGSVSSSMLIESLWSNAQAKGDFSTVVTPQEFGTVARGWPFDTWNASASYLASNGATVKRFLAAFHEAVAYVYAHPDYAIAEAQKVGYTHAEAEAEYNDLSGLKFWPLSGQVSASGLASLIKFGMAQGLLKKTTSASPSTYLWAG